MNIQQRNRYRLTRWEMLTDKFGENIYVGFKYYSKRLKTITNFCPKHGLTRINLNTVMRSNYLCWKCKHEADLKKKKEKIISVGNTKYNGKFDYSKIKLKRGSDDAYKITIVCPIHGEFRQTPNAHIYRAKGCPKCIRDGERLSQDEFITRLKQIHGDKFDYSKTVYTRRADYVIVTCPVHGDIKMKAGNLLSGSYCLKCKRDELRKSREQFIAEANAVHENKYSYENVTYRNNKTKVSIYCPKHGSFAMRPDMHLRGGGCPKCCGSLPERQITDLLSSLEVRFEREFRLPNADNLFRFDFYLPRYKTLIEYHGQQHFRPVTYFGGYKGYLDRHANDIKKKVLARDCGYKLYVFDFNDFENGSLLDKIEELVIDLEKRCFE